MEKLSIYILLLLLIQGCSTITNIAIETAKIPVIVATSVVKNSVSAVGNIAKHAADTGADVAVHTVDSAVDKVKNHVENKAIDIVEEAIDLPKGSVKKAKTIADIL